MRAFLRLFYEILLGSEQLQYAQKWPVRKNVTERDPKIRKFAFMTFE